MPTKLKLTALDEISLVDKGANPGAKIVVLKAKSAPSPKPKPTKKGPTMPKWWKSKEQRRVRKMLPDGMPAPEDMGFSEDQMAYVMALLEMMAEAGEKAEATEEEKGGGYDLDKADPEDGEAMEKIAKALSIPVWVAKERAQDRQRIAKLEAQEEHRVYLAKAEALPHLPGLTTDQIAGVIKSVAKSADEKLFKVFEQALVSWNEAVGKSQVFKELGGAGGEAGSALEEIQKRASELVKSGEAKNMADARRAVRKADKALDRQYRQETQGA